MELGLFNQIKKSPNLINYNSDVVIKRINIMEQIGLSILNERNTINQMARNGNEFFISDDDLDEYQYENYTIFMNNDMRMVLDNNDNIDLIDELPMEISYIEDYKKNDQLYIIGSRCFSRLKVLRMLNTLVKSGFTNYEEMLFNALIYKYPTYINEEMINKLNNLSNNIVKKQLK